MAAAPLTIGQFQVVAEIGRGGMGIVYKVKDARTNQFAALKMIPPDQLVRADSALRFKREFRAMQRVEHPNVIRVFEAGTHDGCPFFTMELVDGKDIRRWLDGDDAIVPVTKDAPPSGVLSDAQRARLNAPLRVKKVADAVMQVAYALSEIHGHRIVHRDLKPDNVLVSKAGVVKLMDFGIAKQMSNQAEQSSGGMVVGTFKYLSPEQALGADIDGRADLYCLGIILYELLAGRHPFYSENSVGYAYHHARKQPPDITRFNPEVHAGLKAVCERLIKKDPRERFATADDVIVAIRASMLGFVEELSKRARVPAPRALPFELARDQLFAPALVGRDPERTTLLSGAESVLAGRGGVFAVTGPAGIGKTRLVRDVAAAARARNIDFVWGACGVDGSLPYQPFIEILDTLIGQAESMPVEGIKRLLGDEGRILARYVPAIGRLPPEVRPRLAAALEPDGERMRFLNAVTAFLGRCAAVQPRVLVVDNLQHADELSLRLARHLVENVAKVDVGESSDYRFAPLALVLTLDPSSTRADDARALLARINQEVGFKSVALSPLSASEIKEMVGSMLGSDDVADALGDFLHAQTRGVPALVEERVRAWAEAGELRKKQGKWVLVKAPAETHGGAATAKAMTSIPDAVEVRAATRADIPIDVDHNPAQRRIARLSAVALDVAVRMAIADDRVPVTLLLRVSLRPEDEFLDALDELIKREFVLEDKTAGVLRFADADDRDALVASVAEQRRQHLHLLIARATEEDARVHRRMHNPEKLARHYLDGGEAERAIEQLIGAGRISLAASATQSAAQRVREAQELLQREFVTRSQDSNLVRCDLELVLLRLDVLAAVNEHKECVALAKRRLPKLRGTADSRLVCEALLRLAASERVLGDLDGALEHVGEVLSATERGGSHALRCRAKKLCGTIYEQRGEFDICERYYADALELARTIGDELEEESASAAIAHRRLISGDLKTAGAEFDRLLKQAQARGENLKVLGYVNSLGIVAHEEGRLNDAEVAYRRMMELAKPAGDRRSVAQGQTNVAVLRRDQQRFDDALSLCAKAARIFVDLNQLEGLSYVRIVEAQVLLDRDLPGDAAAAFDKAELGVELATRSGAALMTAEAQIARGQAASRLGRDDATQDVSRGLAVALAAGANRIALYGLAAEVELCSRRGDRAGAQQAFAKANARSTLSGFTRFTSRLATLRQKLSL